MRQTRDRLEGLVELYQQIAFSIAVRRSMGYLTSKSALGREAGQEPPARNPNKLYNGDTSSTFAADELPVQFHMAAGSREELKRLGRSAGTTKPQGVPTTQRRSSSYFVIGGMRYVVAAVMLFKDKSWKGLRTFRSNMRSTHEFFMVCKGPDVSKRHIADRVEHEIINKVIQEDVEQVDKEESLGQATAMEEESEGAQLVSAHLDPSERHLAKRENFLKILGSHDEEQGDEDEGSEGAMKIKGDMSEDEGSEGVTKMKGDMSEDEESIDSGKDEDTSNHQEKLWREMYERPLFFQDGERNFLVAVLAQLEFGRLCFDLTKSGGACTPFQQLMDRIKSFMGIRQFYNGSEFQRILKLPDNDIIPSSLMKEWEHIINPVDPASRRVFLRFILTFPAQVSKHITDMTLRNGWRESTRSKNEGGTQH